MDLLIKQNGGKEMSKEVDTLTLLSFNTGLLEYRLFGAKLYQNPPFTQQRLLHLPAALLSSGADILALQELYDANHVAFLLERVSSAYPYCGRVDTGNRIALHNGLMVLSKYPIICSRFHPHLEVWLCIRRYTHRMVLWLEGYLGGFSGYSRPRHRIQSFILKYLFFLYTNEKKFSSLLAVTFLNIHMASGAVDPESTYVEAVRNREILQLLKLCSDIGQRGEIPVVIGDLNADPELCASNYKTFLEDGWIDSWLFSSSRMDPYSFLLRGLWEARVSGQSVFHNRSSMIATEGKRIRDLTYWLINAPHPSALDFMNEIVAQYNTLDLSKGEKPALTTPYTALFSVISPPMLWYASALMDDILHHCYHHGYRQQRQCLAVIHAFQKEFSAFLSGKKVSLHHRNSIGCTFMTSLSDASNEPITLFTPDLCEPLIDMHSHISPLSSKMGANYGPRLRHTHSKRLKALDSFPSLTKTLSLLGGPHTARVLARESKTILEEDPRASLNPHKHYSLPSLRASSFGETRTSFPLEETFPDTFVSRLGKKEFSTQEFASTAASPRLTKKEFSTQKSSSTAFSSITWNPQNPLNAIGPHRYCHGLRCDYIFLPPLRFAQQLCHFIPFNAAILFQTPHVALHAGRCCKAVEKVTISDHYAVFVELRRRKSFQTL
ncbi:endonuclease/exonuclease/phosphatase family protein [Cardiosporidium cionae]|uniref:Endonuclease/exonuclease/phosphatase family protein n=1 Tax=Cardiosporidium cionae TaxID=476202 RepID=A0ABQ7J8F6_9APIC|nr:endonuclease/exonuclease/phosphatase family protein [Cardiosporidium cionae]|eukprot:KAF8820249.1 endonuclease/exonuclease/phosphatase family protein [Cardiosporidium cionae]